MILTPTAVLFVAAAVLACLAVFDRVGPSKTDLLAVAILCLTAGLMIAGVR